MAQHIGPAGRSISNGPTVFLAGTLFAVAAFATVIVLALALGVTVGIRNGATAAQPGAPARAIPIERLDRLELDYIRRGHAGHAAPPPRIFGPNAATIDAQEQAYIDDAHAGTTGAGSGDSSWSPGALPRLGRVAR